MVNRIPAKRVLRLRAEGLSQRTIAASQRISRNSITAVYDAADTLDIDFDDIADMDDADVYALLFPGRGEHRSV